MTVRNIGASIRDWLLNARERGGNIAGRERNKKGLEILPAKKIVGIYVGMCNRRTA